MAGSQLFYKIGKLFGEIGGQENIYKKNLAPATAGQEVPMSDFKAVPDDEVDPVQRMARTFSSKQKQQQLVSLFCCIAMVIFILVFLFWGE